MNLEDRINRNKLLIYNSNKVDFQPLQLVKKEVIDNKKVKNENKIVSL